MLKTNEELLHELMNEINKDIIHTKVKIRELEVERVKHQYMGEAEALEGLSAHKKRLKTLERNLKRYQDYDV